MPGERRLDPTAAGNSGRFRQRGKLAGHNGAVYAARYSACGARARGGGGAGAWTLTVVGRRQGGGSPPARSTRRRGCGTRSCRWKWRRSGGTAWWCRTWGGPKTGCIWRRRRTMAPCGCGASRGRIRSPSSHTRLRAACSALPLCRQHHGCCVPAAAGGWCRCLMASAGLPLPAALSARGSLHIPQAAQAAAGAWQSSWARLGRR